MHMYSVLLSEGCVESCFTAVANVGILGCVSTSFEHLHLVFFFLQNSLSSERLEWMLSLNGNLSIVMGLWLDFLSF